MVWHRTRVGNEWRHVVHGCTESLVPSSGTRSAGRWPGMEPSSALLRLPGSDRKLALSNVLSSKWSIQLGYTFDWIWKGIEFEEELNWIWRGTELNLKSDLIEIQNKFSLKMNLRMNWISKWISKWIELEKEENFKLN